MCEHDIGDDAEPWCIVDGLDDAVDPILVVQTSTTVTASHADETVRFVEFIGDLDTYSARHAEPAVTEIVDEHTDVVIDLAGVAFCDSAGLRMIEGFHDRVVANGNRVSIHAPSGIVRRLITMLGIERFDVCEPITSRRRSLRYDTSASSGRRVWEWDEPETTSSRVLDGRRTHRLIELPGTPEHPNRQRLTIDVVLATSGRISPAAGHRHDARFVVAGELDAAAAAPMVICGDRGCLDGVDDVTVDLSRVTLITSAGLRLVERLEQQVRQDGGRFAIAGPSMIVQRLLAIVGAEFEQVDPVRSPFVVVR